MFWKRACGGRRDAGRARRLRCADAARGDRGLTYIYWYDNGLYELFCEAGSGLLPEDGERLLDLDSLSFDLADGLLRVTCADGGERYETCLALRAEGGAA